MTDTHPPVNHGKTGVLLLSLGTPDAPTYGALRRYLAEFLSDPRVIEVPRPLWLPILYGPILTFRPGKAAKAYAKIWDRERNESPLRGYARAQAEKLQGILGGDVKVDWAFRYGTPSVEERLTRMKEDGCDRILLFALYPQYSASTTASAHDKAFEVLTHMRWQPAIRTVPPYYDKAVYADTLAASVKASLATLDWQPEKILASYHSIPKAYWDKGDPYPCQCMATSRMLKERLGLDDESFVTCFQSRVGPAEWVGPYSDKMVEQLARDGVKKIAILAPAFSADCVETLEEVDMGLRETFMEHGGTHFHYIPCLNDTDAGMDMLASVVRTELSGWGG
ncbi:ferrochelatase [Kordiimonas marina]|uniref:ferrochelatase n=1 Tax=Kordiimonas marina TaxID=2872312 RepID=UPI001FF35024|nr:ferrochelatase [Kordiimonas marina]MCJ9428379.1 ferrochelatase [Kordiimonas marina]